MAEVLERGAVFFLYRPKVDVERVTGLDDVQGVFLVLEPDGDEPARRIELGRKSLPPQGWAGRRHGWAFVAEVAGRAEQLEVEDHPEAYETKTRGRRVQPEDRPLGEGTYELVRHGDHVHLSYVLERPDEPGPAQEATNVDARRSLHVKVKDPTKQSPGQRTPTTGRTEPLPDELQSRFGGRRFVAADPPAFLDHEGVELLLMPAGADDDPGESPDPEDDDHDLFADLDVDPDAVPTAPLERGEWA